MSQHALTVNTCKTHGAAYFTAPNKNGMSVCTKCLQEGMAKNPEAYHLTDKFLDELKGANSVKIVERP